MNKYDELLKQFCTKDDLRGSMLNPMQWKDCNVATNGHVLIAVPQTLCEEQYNKATLNIDSVMPELNCNIRHEIKAIKKLFEKVELVECVDEVKGTCKECSGEGEKYCYACEHSNPCSNCDGTGQAINEVPNGKFEKKFNHKISFSKSNYMCGYLSLLVSVAETLEVKTIIQKAQYTLKANLFTIGDVTILLMPVGDI